MKRLNKIVCVVFFLIVLCACNNKKELVNKEHNGYQLTIYQVGDPEFPYGPTTCLIKLKNGNNTIVNQEIVLLNDGANATSDNFVVSFFDDHAEVVVKASEQEDVSFYLDYDGKIE